MWTLAQYDLVPIAVAMLIGLAAGWWLFRRRGERAGHEAGPTPGVMAETPKQEPPR